MVRQDVLLVHHMAEKPEWQATYGHKDQSAPSLQ